MIGISEFYPVNNEPSDPVWIQSNEVIMSKWTGEFRPPRKGEYFLSGAIVMAYRAPYDLKRPYHIAKLVRVISQLVEVGDL